MNELINKKQFVAEMSKVVDIKKVDAAYCTEAFLATMYYLISNGKGINFLGDMRIEAREVKERIFPNPRDRKQLITMPAHKKLVCKMGKRMQYLANGGTIEGVSEITE